MHARQDVAAVAALIGDTTRALILDALMAGRALPATELAQRANVSAQTMSAHLAKLCHSGLLAAESHGRHRFFRLANEQVAAAVEALGVIAPQTAVVSLRQSDEVKALKRARTCYDHLAGFVGVAVASYLLKQRHVTAQSRQFLIAKSGRAWLAAFGVDLAVVERSRRKTAPSCLDWSERQPHIGGALGAALMDRMFELRWFSLHPKHRGLALTEAGVQGLRRIFKVQL